MIITVLDLSIVILLKKYINILYNNEYLNV